MKKSSLLLFGMMILGSISFTPTVEAIGRFDDEAMYSTEMRERHMWQQENSEQRRKRNTQDSHMRRDDRRD
ncbi:hypothetical protein [Enterococcus wangshanyuanii]|uniref:Secreted protein n=1 Tax=Enterococcus wangshanyuanii TaxID=2005703 RepID=A0ABQ1PWG3_9ENTE|nr:hypothetical protein [Enterococcus wangshanyuanii]GGD04754.1 hypothetical protein GCM10011573_37810 [Enterococcus wangshanyuanii]